MCKAAERLDPERTRTALETHASEALKRSLPRAAPHLWYPAEAHLELLDLLWHHVALRDPDTMAELGGLAIGDDLRGAHRMLLRVLSPAYLIHTGSRLFRAYVNYGNMEVRERDAFSAVVRLTLQPASEPFFMTAPGAVRAALAHCGAEAVTLDAARHPDGIDLFLRWR